MLGANKIKKEIKHGNIVIAPFTEDQLNPNSYDIRLGNWFIEENVSNLPVDLTRANADWNLWQKPRKVDNECLFILEPGAYILAHTIEIVGSTKYATLLKARSTFARCGIDICASAGFGDVGYVNHWTLEIKNNTRNSIILQPKMRVAQIAFIKVQEASQYQGAYQSRLTACSWNNPLEIASTYDPLSMLPKLGYSRVF